MYATSKGSSETARMLDWSKMDTQEENNLREVYNVLGNKFQLTVIITTISHFRFCFFVLHFAINVNVKHYMYKH